MNSPPQPFSFIPFPPISRVVSTGIIFAFTYMCIYTSSRLLPLFSPSEDSESTCLKKRCKITATRKENPKEEAVVLENALTSSISLTFLTGFYQLKNP
jgi:hypothetical protein